MAYVIQPLQDVDAASSLRIQSPFDNLVSPFTFRPLEDKPQDPIFERLSAARQLESLDLDAQSPSVLNALVTELPDYETNYENDASSVDSVWLDAATYRSHTLQVSLQLETHEIKLTSADPERTEILGWLGQIAPSSRTLTS